MKHLSNDHEDHPSQHENNHKLCIETGDPVETMMESQWKLRQQHNQNFPMQEKVWQNKYQRQKKERNPEKQDYENHNLGSEQES